MSGFFSRYTEVKVYPPRTGRMKYRKLLIFPYKCVPWAPDWVSARSCHKHRDQTKLVQIIKLDNSRFVLPTAGKRIQKFDWRQSLLCFSLRNELDWLVRPKNASFLLTWNLQSCKTQLMKHQLITKSSSHLSLSLTGLSLACRQYYFTLFKMLLLSQDSGGFVCMCVMPGLFMFANTSLGFLLFCIIVWSLRLSISYLWS